MLGRIFNRKFQGNFNGMCNRMGSFTINFSGKSQGNFDGKFNWNFDGMFKWESARKSWLVDFII